MPGRADFAMFEKFVSNVSTQSGTVQDTLDALTGLLEDAKKTVQTTLNRGEGGVSSDAFMATLQNAITQNDVTVRDEMKRLVYSGVFDPVEYFKIISQFAARYPLLSFTSRMMTQSKDADVRACDPCWACAACVVCPWSATYPTVAVGATASYQG